MITTLQAVIQGIVEGITEFLPISSTGHLIVSERLIGMPKDDAFEIVIQLGAIIAVVWYYREELLEQLRRVAVEPIVRRLWLNLLIAFLPVAVIGLLAHKHIKALLFSPLVVAASLVIGGVILIVTDSEEAEEAQRFPNGIYDLMPGHALKIGVAQLFSLIPGMSRSGSTIVGGMLTGLDRATATKFSFFLAIPTLGSATLYEMLKERHHILAGGNTVPFLIGTAVSFVVALMAIGWLLRFISSNSFKGFGIYRIVAGLTIVALVYGGVIPRAGAQTEGGAPSVTPSAAPSVMASPSASGRPANKLRSAGADDRGLPSPSAKPSAGERPVHAR